MPCILELNQITIRNCATCTQKFSKTKSISTNLVYLVYCFWSDCTLSRADKSMCPSHTLLDATESNADFSLVKMYLMKGL